ncbi:MAG: hypothetical protein ACPLXC_03260 [Candidatus Pacearchaeota archaeon]
MAATATIKTSVKKKKWVRIVLLMVIIALLTITLTELIFYYSKYVYKVKKVTVYDMKMEVGNHVGFNLDAEELNFGTVPPGGGSKREVVITTDSPTLLKVMFEGELADWVSVSENDFIFNGSKSLTFLAVSPENTSLGFYKGKAIIVLKEP